jgi:hypothetical protein
MQQVLPCQTQGDCGDGPNGEPSEKKVSFHNMNLNSYSHKFGNRATRIFPDLPVTHQGILGFFGPAASFAKS